MLTAVMAGWLGAPAGAAAHMDRRMALSSDNASGYIVCSYDISHFNLTTRGSVHNLCNHSLY